MADDPSQFQRLTVRLPGDLLDGLANLARRRDSTASREARLAIRRYLQVEDERQATLERKRAQR